MFFLLQLSIFTIAYMNDFKIKAYGNVILHHYSVARSAGGYSLKIKALHNVLIESSPLSGKQTKSFEFGSP